MTIKESWILGFCRLGFAGLSPKAPGTCGTALACLLAPVFFLPLAFGGCLLLLTALFTLGGLAATRAEIILGRKDPGEIVIDELVGVWLVLLPFAQAGFGLVLAAFAFFRLFDIWKPWPVRRAEYWLDDGFGVMADDVVAGLWALACVAALRGLGWV